MTEIISDADEDKREYSRVDVYIPIEFKQITHVQKDKLRCRMAGESIIAEFKSLPNPDDQLIAQWLQSINAKLDEIIRMLTRQHDGFNSLNIAKVNIGGGGMCLQTEQFFAPGDVLEIKVMLGLQPPVALFLYGEIIDSDVCRGEYDTAVRFFNMDDLIRDAIVRFVFESEREILREKRR